MTIFYLLIGILLAALVFGALMWSVVQAVRGTGNQRMNYGILAAATLGGMLALTYDLGITARMIGGLLIYFGGVAFVAEQGSARALPLVQIILGLCLLVGLTSAIA